MSDIFNYATATDEQVLRHEAQVAVSRVTANLRRLADRLDARACAFQRDYDTSASIIADIINDYTQGVGSAGNQFWGLVRELGRQPDRPRQAAPATPTENKP